MYTTGWGDEVRTGPDCAGRIAYGAGGGVANARERARAGGKGSAAVYDPADRSAGRVGTGGAHYGCHTGDAVAIIDHRSPGQNRASHTRVTFNHDNDPVDGRARWNREALPSPLKVIRGLVSD